MLNIRMTCRWLILHGTPTWIIFPMRGKLQYFGSLTAADPNGDADGDGVNNLAEYQAGTDPTDDNSLFALSGSMTNNEFTLSWIPVEGIEYSVLWTTNLLDGFTAVVSGLSYPQNSFTGMVQEGFPVGFSAIGAERVITNSAVVRQVAVQLDGNDDDWQGLLRFSLRMPAVTAFIRDWT